MAAVVDNIDPCRMLDMYSLLNKKLIHEKGSVGRAERWRKRREEKKGKRNEPFRVFTMLSSFMYQ